MKAGTLLEHRGTGRSRGSPTGICLPVCEPGVRGDFPSSPRSDVGRHVYEVLAEVWSQIQPRLDQALSGERVSYELTLAGRAKAEAPRSFAVSYEPHVDRDGQRTVVIVVVDIMTGKRAEEALPASESRLRELAVQLEHRVAERPRELEHSHSRLS
jgi:hypothetical protein